MNCECKLEVEKMLLEHYQQATPEANGHGVELNGYGLSFANDTAELKGYMTYEGIANHPLKKGGEKSKTMRGHMFFSYCPFCGTRA